MTSSHATKSIMRNQGLRQLLTSPKQLARMLDWKRTSDATVLCLNIRKKVIEVAVASHPLSSCWSHQQQQRETNEQPPCAVPIPAINVTTANTNNKLVHVSRHAADELMARLEEWNSCGILVRWPVEQEGWYGGRCGRVLYTLDQILLLLQEKEKDNNKNTSLWSSSSSSSVANRLLDGSCPICLWDPHHRFFDQDGWGRSSMYSHIPSMLFANGTTTTTTVCMSSLEEDQLDDDDDDHHQNNINNKNDPATVNMWNDFCQVHWPELRDDNDEWESSFA